MEQKFSLTGLSPDTSPHPVHQVRVLDPRGNVCALVEATGDGVRINGVHLAVSLARGNGDVCKILLTPAEKEEP